MSSLTSLTHRLLFASSWYNHCCSGINYKWCIMLWRIHQTTSRTTPCFVSFDLGFFPSAVTMVGSSHLVFTAIHTPSVIPQTNSFIRAFHWPYRPAFNMIVFCIKNRVHLHLHDHTNNLGDPLCYHLLVQRCHHN